MPVCAIVNADGTISVKGGAIRTFVRFDSDGRRLGYGIVRSNGSALTIAAPALTGTIAWFGKSVSVRRSASQRERRQTRADEQQRGGLGGLRS